jgi:hypothetical protein
LIVYVYDYVYDDNINPEAAVNLNANINERRLCKV